MNGAAKNRTMFFRMRPIPPASATGASAATGNTTTFSATAGAARYLASDGETLDLFAAPEREIVRLRRDEIHYVPQFLKAPPRVPAVDVVASVLVRRGTAVGERLKKARRRQ